MSKILFLFFVTAFLSLNIQGEDINDKLLQLGYYEGDPNENTIIGSGEMYVVIHNPTLLSITVTNFEAIEYCTKTLGEEYT